MAESNIAGTSTGDFVKLDNVILDVFSQEILLQAQPILRFEQIARIQTELGVLPGQTVKMLKFHALTGDSDLDETEDLEAESIATSTVSISVTEHGKALRFSEALLRASVTDILQNAASLLGNHYGTSRDGLIRDALMGGTSVLYAGGKSTRGTLTGGDLFDVDLVREAVETLATNKAPKFGDAYVAFVHPHQSKTLRKDGAWVNCQLYNDPANILNGECGRIEDVRFIETTQVWCIKSSAGATAEIWADGQDTGLTTAVTNTATDVYRSVAVGDYAVGVADALPVEMRDNGVENYGRYHSIAYYGIYGAGLIETGHSVCLETA